MLLLSLSLHSSSPTFKLLSMASYSGELLLDSSSPWSGISNHLSSFSILLPFIFKKKRTPLMKKIQGLQAPYGATSCGIRASSSRWCSFVSSIFLFGEFSLIPQDNGGYTWRIIWRMSPLIFVNKVWLYDVAMGYSKKMLTSPSKILLDYASTNSIKFISNHPHQIFT